ANKPEDALAAAAKVGYPVLVRPSYVLGGRAREIIYNQEELERWLQKGFLVTPGSAVLIDEFLENAIEIDVDAISDGRA
ncbi:hypothetical protein ABTH20_21750, partial [Acinetobacter baumannii]